MYLYKLEFQIGEKTVHVIVAADSDEQAFKYADAELEKHFITMPNIAEAAIVEKKSVRKGTGYVIE